MTAEILVIGAPGNVGTPVVEQALEKGLRLRIAAYDDALARETFAGVDVVHFDFYDESTYSAAFEGIRQVFFIRPPQIADIKEAMVPALEFAKEQGVKHMIFLSILGVNRRMPHYDVEKYLKKSGIRYTFLRSGFFMQNFYNQFLEDIRDRNEIFVAVGKGKMAIVDARDVAAVAVHSLNNNPNGNTIYELTGSKALNYYDIANAFSEGLNRTITYPKPSGGEFREHLIKQGNHPELVEVLNGLFMIVRLRRAGKVTKEISKILGRDPTTLQQFILDYKHYWN